MLLFIQHTILYSIETHKLNNNFIHSYIFNLLVFQMFHYYLIIYVSFKNKILKIQLKTQSLELLSLNKINEKE